MSADFRFQPLRPELVFCKKIDLLIALNLAKLPLPIFLIDLR